MHEEGVSWLYLENIEVSKDALLSYEGYNSLEELDEDFIDAYGGLPPTEEVVKGAEEGGGTEVVTCVVFDGLIVDDTGKVVKIY